MPDGLEIIPVRGMGEVRPGIDLAEAIASAAPWLRDGDVLVVTSKIVSKAEGRLVDVPVSGPEREAAREEVLAAETARPVARRGGTRIVETHHGFVLASAGIDASNVEGSRLVLLPKDPDASARGLRTALKERTGLNVAVIVSDTMGRPWRNGLTDVALGAAGLDAIRDYRGQIDAYGNELHITQMAVADELAAAADLVKGKRDQVPVAVVRGFLGVGPAEDGAGAVVLLREPAQDLFSLGTAEAHAAGVLHAAGLVDASDFGEATDVSGGAVERALARVAPAVAGSTRLLPRSPGLPDADVPAGTAHVIQCAVADPGDSSQLFALGVDVHRLRCALAAEGLATKWLPANGGPAVGILAVGASVSGL
jgi:coenzyme F420-0:L-glutamate ligase/coenzyme F420-1:gamma-L-glutamate ligase